MNNLNNSEDLIQNLSNRSLFLLDQVSVLKNDEDFLLLCLHIDSLKSFEKKIFIKLLEKENMDFYERFKNL